MILSRALIALWLAMSTSVISAETSAATIALPRKAPVPQPSERPSPPPEEAPATVPIPTPRPGDETASEKPPQEKPVPVDPRSAEKPRSPLPAEEASCRERLKTLGVQFEASEARHDEKIGCALPYPLVVNTLGPAIGLEPKAEMNCRMAEAAARFMAGTVAPTARSQLGAGLKSVSQASAYVCRPRHNREKMSEHAFGNALDIASFTLTDGRRIDVEASPDGDGARKFLAEVRKAACGPFKTVLGPGSDADHAVHFHLDLEPRRNGGTFCQ
jgi:hypothetical protein